MLYEPKVTYRNALFSILAANLFTHYTFTPCVPPPPKEKIRGRTSLLLSPNDENLVTPPRCHFASRSLSTLQHSMRQNCKVSVRLSVPAVDSCSSVRRVCCRWPSEQDISIYWRLLQGRRPAAMAPRPQQHGAACSSKGERQQMRAVSRFQPP